MNPTPEKISLDILIGTETYDRQSRTLYAYTHDPVTHEEKTFDKSQHLGLTPTRRNRFNAMRGMDAAFGTWTDSIWLIPAGTIVKLTFDKTRYGQPLSKCVLFIVPRKGAALNRITFDLIRDVRSVKEEAVVEGHFDILTEESFEDYHVERGRLDRAFVGWDEVEETILLEELSPATEDAPIALTRSHEISHGDKVVVVDTNREISRTLKPRRKL